ncbi:hypothetical protein KDW_19930 [Dictyobacter vulcani]|uniref:Uncharacterized protein n=1 Tax=Dictyobacter vulcani TaxID=2607529 RepID=A0A5J4KNE7_9CHLR|nr:hypothetical protein KDW_19930 [Dictyobacter vulcani]
MGWLTSYHSPPAAAGGRKENRGAAPDPRLRAAALNNPAQDAAKTRVGGQGKPKRGAGAAGQTQAGCRGGRANPSGVQGRQGKPKRGAGAASP